MIAREKCTWFGYVLAASFLSSLWPDVATSPSPIRRGWDNLPRRAHPPRRQEGPRCCSGPANCKPTQPDMLGPFYEPGAPVRTSVGSGYELSGTVLAAKECKPIPNAHIEFWLANPRETTTTHLRSPSILLLALSHMFHGSSKPPQTSL